MRVSSSSMISRIFFVTLFLFCCTWATGLRAFGNLQQASSPSAVQAVPAASRARTPDTSSPDFTLQISPSPLTIAFQFDGSEEEGEADGSATLTGTNGFVGQVDLTCSVAPPSLDEPVCFLFQNPVNVDASGAPSVAKLAVDSSPPDCEPSPISSKFPKFPGNPGWRGPMTVGVLLLAIVICLAVILPAGRRAKILRAGFICLAALVMAGCGASAAKDDPCGIGNFDPGTPAGTYMVTIAATSGNITHTATVSLIVPPAD
jgi:hypothetical protein